MVPHKIPLDFHQFQMHIVYLASDLRLIDRQRTEHLYKTIVVGLPTTFHACGGQSLLATILLKVWPGGKVESCLPTALSTAKLLQTPSHSNASAEGVDRGEKAL